MSRFLTRGLLVDRLLLCVLTGLSQPRVTRHSHISAVRRFLVRCLVRFGAFIGQKQVLRRDLDTKGGSN